MAISTKAFGYIRVSGQGQAEGDGPIRQREAIDRYASANRIEIVETFEDLGVSGTKGLADRPGLAELLARVLSNGVRVVVVERADRLARDLVEGELILRELRSAGVRVVTSEGVDLSEGDDSDPTSKLIRQVLGAVSEFEKSSIVLKLRAARNRRSREAGRRIEGRKPYGPEVEDRVRELRRKPRGEARKGYGEIAEILTAEGFATKSGRPWSRQTVRTICNRLGLPSDGAKKGGTR